MKVALGVAAVVAIVIVVFVLGRIVMPKGETEGLPSLSLVADPVYVVTKYTREDFGKSSTMKFEYDANGNVLGVTYNPDSDGDKKLENDANGFPATMRWTSSKSFDNKFDSSGLLIASSLDNDYEFSYSANGILDGYKYTYGDLSLTGTGLPERCSGFGYNGHDLSYSWENDASGHPVSCTVQRISAIGDEGSDVKTWQASVSTDEAGNITSITDERGQSRFFEYKKIDNPSQAA